MTPIDGALGIALFEDQNVQDPYPLYKRMHQHGPIHRIGSSGFYAVTGWDTLDEAVTRCQDFSSNLTATMVRDAGGAVGAYPMGELGGPTQVLATADDPAHTAHRRALTKHLAARRLVGIESFVAETATRVWGAGLKGGRIEWMESMANRLPMMVVGHILGVPASDTDKLVRWGYAATQFVEGLVTREELVSADLALTELSGYITEQLGHAAEDPRDNLLGDLARACAAGELDEVTAQVILVTLFSAGGESTASLIGTAAKILAADPDVQQQVRDTPDLLPVFLEEVLRFESPFRGHYRHVVHDTQLGGVDLPAGSPLLLMWGAANRDPGHFPDPDRFRLDRPARKNHLAFGRGAHFCVGAALARLEASVVLRRVLERSEHIRIEEAGHWLPSLLVRRLARLHLAVT